MNNETKESISREIMSYCETELDWKLGRFEAEELVQLLVDKISKVEYNRGLQEALAVFSRKMEDVSGEIYILEK